MSNNRVRVGILGATGMVGQRFVQMLQNHPEFQVTALAASDRSQGKTYGEACTWRLVGDVPAFAKSMVVQPPQPPLDCDVVVSSLPSDVARSSEEAFARAGYPVVSNASSFRMDADVPLLIPEINSEHLKVLDRQKKDRGFSSGYIVTNPNCSTIIMALALAPLHAKFGIEAVIATTLQAVSGAGYPGVPSLDVVDNVLPFIDGEEPKMESETRKILGHLGNNSFENAPFGVSAQCHRVNVADGHMVATRVKLAKRASIEEVREALASYTSVPQKLKLHTAPKHPVLVRDEKDRPQPRMDRDAGGGMSVTVGRLFPDSVFDYRFVVLGHNTIRGAAGAAILNLELLQARGLLHGKPAHEDAAPAEARVR
ncbi:MAG TPA: aspartate-semialdehyde dehydrogenase [Candidatus Acidoferrales bacterium]|nr:aspartate-semialdehyde dehydrogenase [Candidatus Acidoferrales bacterium]